MGTVAYPAKPYSKLTRQQLLTLAIALEDMRDRLAEQVALVAKLHQPHHEPGLGYDGAGGYGEIPKVCRSCGIPDEYGVPWPCPTALALGEVATT